MYLEAAMRTGQVLNKRIVTFIPSWKKKGKGQMTSRGLHLVLESNDYVSMAK